MSNLRSIYRSVNAPASGDSGSPPKSTTWGVDLLLQGLPEARVFTNVDTIHFGLHVIWSDSGEHLFEQLETHKQLARNENNFSPVPMKIADDYLFNCDAYGKRGGYAYHINTADIDLFFSRHDPGGQTPNVFVEIGSISCWSSGVRHVVHNIYKLLELIGGAVIKVALNRIDLAADYVGIDIKDLPLSNPLHWIRQSREFHLFGTGIRFTGAVFGQGGSLSLRVYDKVTELKPQPVKQAVFAEMWEVLKYDDLPVTRVEFQIRKDVLKEFKVRNFKDLENRLEGVWNYCTSKWFRLAEKAVNRTNQTSSKVHPWWEHVNSLKWTGLRYIKRVKEVGRKSLDGLLKQAAGLAKSVGAILSTQPGDIEGIIAYFQGLVEGELREQYRKNYKKFERKCYTRLSECWAML